MVRIEAWKGGLQCDLRGGASALWGTQQGSPQIGRMTSDLCLIAISSVGLR